ASSGDCCVRHCRPEHEDYLFPKANANFHPDSLVGPWKRNVKVPLTALDLADGIFLSEFRATPTCVLMRSWGLWRSLLFLQVISAVWGFSTGAVTFDSSGVCVPAHKARLRRRGGGAQVRSSQLGWRSLALRANAARRCAAPRVRLPRRSFGLRPDRRLSP